ncbi:MAG: SMI1/KNR4 family protein [Pseudobdellovibrionaceae bacterium]|nr:SMI1/KNR4 family protein [Pseudobdellovibrionaceae bacterium]
MLDFKKRFCRNDKTCSQSDIKNLENLIGFRLPEDYKNFLLELNGGFSENMLLFPLVNKKGKPIRGSIEMFYGIDDESDVGLKYQFDLYHRQQKRMPTGLIPIGQDAGSNKICLLLSDIGYGKVFFWDHNDEVDFDEDEDEAFEPMRNTMLAAESFTEFLSKLTEDTED